MTRLTFDLLFDAARRADRTAAKRIIIPCPSCGGEGRISYSHGNDPSPRYSGWCEDCSGYGTKEIEAEDHT